VLELITGFAGFTELTGFKGENTIRICRINGI
jgi:hypothetical protein